jgi:hypothetical protein
MKKFDIAFYITLFVTSQIVCILLYWIKNNWIYLLIPTIVYLECFALFSFSDLTKKFIKKVQEVPNEVSPFT